jgi:hypothetical protein
MARQRGKAEAGGMDKKAQIQDKHIQPISC